MDFKLSSYQNGELDINYLYIKIFIIINLFGFLTVGLEKIILNKRMENKYKFIKDN